MKLKLFLFPLSILFSTAAFAQHAMIESEDAFSTVEELGKESPTLSPEELYLHHTKMAARQFQNHLASSIVYPDYLEGFCLEGELIVEVAIAKNGDIETVKTIKSLHDNLDQLVVSSVLDMKKIKTDEVYYMGAKRLRIPVNFSML